MTKLNSWMGESRDDRWLADVLGCSRSQASRVRRGKSKPSATGAFAIEKATRGGVRAIDLLDPPANDDTTSQDRAA